MRPCSSCADTLFGVTYMVVAPEHPLLPQLATAEQAEAVAAYAAAAAKKSDLERTELSKQKSGVFTGSCAINPATGEAVPVWVADYVLGSYGSGAIMAVPGHDSRDYAFALAFGLPVRQVVAAGSVAAAASGSSSGSSSGNGASPSEASSRNSSSIELPFTATGVAVNSASSSSLDINGRPTEEAKAAVIDWLQREGLGHRQVRCPAQAGSSTLCTAGRAAGAGSCGAGIGVACG